MAQLKIDNTLINKQHTSEYVLLDEAIMAAIGLASPGIIVTITEGDKTVYDSRIHDSRALRSTRR